MSMILGGVLAGWGISTAASVVCWLLYVMVWTRLYGRAYPTTAACKADFDRDPVNRVLYRWMFLSLIPLVVLLYLWRCSSAFLAHQHSIEQLKQQGWQVETYTYPDGTMVVSCEMHMEQATKEDAMAEGAAIIEEGGQL